ncbi:DNA-binding protein [Streptomyces sp. NA02950]|uniref:helix-turn-helix transcriptional regulator n=1 Tax=Streptomyces sp. NA02950 TaxID=2742137 RepID=UPI00158FCE3F|nr:DNA-binding protein [Streptomyces sp. NA02950]QKV94223.1 DNA-binding protein [Streptomyces sp. NA02950]
MTDPLLTPKDVEAEYGIDAQTLANWRWMGMGPDYIKTSPARSARVHYRRSAIDRWLDARTVQTGGTAA